MTTQALDIGARLEARCAQSPQDAAAWRALGRHCAETWNYDRARQCIERALALEPDRDADISLLGWLLNELGEPNRALAVLDPAGAPCAVSFDRLLRHALLLPRIYDSRAALDRWRRRYADHLLALCADPSRYCPDARVVLDLNQTNFLLAYQGGDDLELQRRYAGMIGKLIAGAYPDLVRARPGRAHPGRIRVAFLTGFLHACTIAHYFRAWIEDLPPSIFETVVIYTGATPDATTDEIGARASRFIRAHADALTVAQTVLGVQPDILVYPEVGMQSDTYLLSNMRLAPVQCAAWGHPVTTGSSRIDYYFTCDAMEPEDAQRHYSERLLRLPGIGTRYRRPAAPPMLTRAALGMPPNGHMYVCPQSLFKVHPDNDELFLDILNADEDAFIVFFQDPARADTQALAGRLARGLEHRGMQQRRQIKFAPFTTGERFRSFLALADVVLDTLHWSGGNTTLDVLGVGTPLVTWPGAYMRGRQSAAMLGMIGVPELVVDGREAYVRTAVRIASDPAYRKTLSQRILTGLDAIFDRPEPIVALARHLQSIHRGG